MSFIHPLADVAESQIGQGTKIWQFVVVLKGAIIGKNCNICAQTLIEGNVVIGNNVTVKSGVQLWEGTRIGDNAMVGAGAVVTKDVPANAIVAGNPAKIIRFINAENAANKESKMNNLDRQTDRQKDRLGNFYAARSAA